MDMALPWKTKGIVLTAPLTHEMDSVVRLIEEYLAPNGCNLIVLQTRYRYQFRLHPECQGYDPLSYGDVKRLLAACRRNGIRLLPKMNLLGHQSGVPNRPTDGILHGHGGRTPDIRDGLLRAYPEFDEEPDLSLIHIFIACKGNGRLYYFPKSDIETGQIHPKLLIDCTQYQ